MREAQTALEYAFTLTFVLLAVVVVFLVVFKVLTYGIKLVDTSLNAVLNEIKNITAGR